MKPAVKAPTRGKTAAWSRGAAGSAELSMPRFFQAPMGWKNQRRLFGQSWSFFRGNRADKSSWMNKTHCLWRFHSWLKFFSGIFLICWLEFFLVGNWNIVYIYIYICWSLKVPEHKNWAATVVRSIPFKTKGIIIPGFVHLLWCWGNLFPQAANMLIGSGHTSPGKNQDFAAKSNMKIQTAAHQIDHQSNISWFAAFFFGHLDSPIKPLAKQQVFWILAEVEQTYIRHVNSPWATQIIYPSNEHGSGKWPSFSRGFPHL